MTRRKLEDTKEIFFKYNENFDGKSIILLKDENDDGRKYTPKGAYNLIITIKKEHPSIQLAFDEKAEKMIMNYVEHHKKSKEPLRGLLKILEPKTMQHE